ncbi:MAG TPA: choice-of-anchor D domain-containing protein, partial [Terriglobia bacterium]|nr:choice-of-anchor D domain-containing protein [Terriglobia bacterium]
AGQNVTTTSPAQMITLTNTGDAILTISSVVVSGDYADADTCGTTVAPGVSCSLPVTFTPTLTGIRIGAITLNDNVAGNSQTIALSGTGTAPIVMLSPASLTFAGQLLSTSSAAQEVQLTNSGTGPLTITSIAASGDYAQTNNCVSPVAAGTSCAINVTFTPSATGTRTGAVTITDNAAVSPESVSLSGSGTSPIVTLSATSLAFANQGLTTTSAARAVHLTNSGTGPLTITSIVASGDFAQTNTCASLVAAGGICDISITFTPSTSGTKTGNLTISDDSGATPQTVALTGTGVVAFSLESGQSTATVIAGTDSTTYPILLSSQFGFTGAVSLSCSVSAPAACAVNPTSAAPGQAVVLTVNNLTAFTGMSGTITVTGTSGSQSAQVTLTILISDFTLASLPTSTSVASGQPARYSISLAPENSFNHVVSLSCSGAPQAATCSISPNSMAMDGSSTLIAGVTITTTAHSGVGGRWRGPQDLPEIKSYFGHSVWWLAFITILFFISVAVRKNGLRLAPCGAALFLALLCGNCGGGGGGGGGGGAGGGTTGTPAGSYTLTITATSGGLSHAVTVNLTVF